VVTSEVLVRSVQRADGRGLFAWDALRFDLEGLTRGGEIVWVGPNPFVSPWFPRAVHGARARGYRSWACIDDGGTSPSKAIAAAAEAGLWGVVLPSRGAEAWAIAAGAYGLRVARTWDASDPEVATRAAAEGASLRWAEGSVPDLEMLAHALSRAEASGVVLRATFAPSNRGSPLTWSTALEALLVAPAPRGFSDAPWTLLGVPDPRRAAEVHTLGARTPDLPRCYGGEAVADATPGPDPACDVCTVAQSCRGPTREFPARPVAGFRPLPPGARIAVVGDTPEDWVALSPVAEAFGALGFHVARVGPLQAEDAPGVDSSPARTAALAARAWNATDLGTASLIVTPQRLVERYRCHPSVRPHARWVSPGEQTSSDGSVGRRDGSWRATWALVRAWAFGTPR
jgi:hypothetical protein